MQDILPKVHSTWNAIQYIRCRYLELSSPCCLVSRQQAAAPDAAVVVDVSYIDLSEAKCWKVEETGHVSVS